MRTVERSAAWMLWALLLLSVVQRAFVLGTFGFQYIGIDDALIQQVAIDYGNGIFREPYLYGQNYNPMLEALLAAPFVRLGGAPWIVLPIITSLLALLPFWSIALWCRRNGQESAALVFAAMPLLLPTEWGLITTMPRGFVHGIALLGLVPWIIHLPRPGLKHGLTSLVLAGAVLCNPNALPVAAGIGVWLFHHDYRSRSFWVNGLFGIAPVLAYYMLGQHYFNAHPDHLVHELSKADLGFDLTLLKEGLMDLKSHLLHMTPFPPKSRLLAPLITAMAIVVFWRRKQKALALALTTAVLIYVGALGVVKVHEGCASVFFPLSRMFLALPILLGPPLALVLAWAPFTKRAALLVFGGAVVSAAMSTMELDRTIQHELASQECGYVREEPLSLIRSRCEAIKTVALTNQANVVAPIRWPGIRMDHEAHFVAHFTCYACAQLVQDFPPVVGIGFDRRSWVREEFSARPPDRVLFIGGDPLAWERATQEHPGIETAKRSGLLFHTLTSDTATIEKVILDLGVDDDLRR